MAQRCSDVSARSCAFRIAASVCLLTANSVCALDRVVFDSPLRYWGGQNVIGSDAMEVINKNFQLFQSPGVQKALVNCRDEVTEPPGAKVCTMTQEGGPDVDINGHPACPTWVYVGSRPYCGHWESEDSPRGPENLGDPPCPPCAKGNPINVATGNKYQREVDIDAAYPGGVSFSRFYNSAAAGAQRGDLGRFTPMGMNWTHNWYRRIERLGPVFAFMWRPDGKQYDANLVNGVWQADPEVPEILSESAAGWTLVSRDNEIEQYDTEGRLTSVTDAAGRVTTLLYSDGSSSGPSGGVYEGTTYPLSPGTLLSVVDYRGRALRFTYVWSGLIRSVTAPDGLRYEYLHDGNQNLSKVTYGDGSGAREYLYNEPAFTSGNGLVYHLTGIRLYEAGSQTPVRFATFEYQSSGEAKATQHAGGAERYSTVVQPNGTVVVTDALATAKTYSFAVRQGTKLQASEERPCDTCGSGKSTASNGFDANGNVVSRIDHNGTLSCHSYDTVRNLEIGRTEGLSSSGSCTSRVPTSATRTITTEWHSTWRVPRRIAEPLRVVTFSYHGDAGTSCAATSGSRPLLCSKSVQATSDANGSQGFTASGIGLARQWAYAYNTEGAVLTIDGPRADVADVTTFTYYSTADPAGKFRAGDLWKITNARGHVTEFTEYDGAGRMKKSVDPNLMETVSEYWPRGWLKSRAVGTAATGYEVTNFEYNVVGGLKRVTLPDMSTLSHTYDDARRLTRVDDGLGNSIRYGLDLMSNRLSEEMYDPSGVLARSQTRVFDSLSRLKELHGGTTPALQKTVHGYDANGNLITVQDPLQRITQQIVDARGRLVEVRDPFNGAAHPTTYEYDGLDQLLRVTDPKALSTIYSMNGHGEMLTQSSPDTGTTTSTYDEASNLKTKLDARGIQAAYTYDELNRITGITYPDESVGYAYDSCTNGVGRLCMITDGVGTTSFAYDSRGRVALKTQVVGAVTQSIAYAYNAAGQLRQVTTPSGQVVQYAYVNNRPVSVSVNGTTILDSVLYDPFGPNGGWRWGNHTPGAPNYHTRVMDLDYRTSRVTSDLPAAAGTHLFDRGFSWDEASRIGSTTDYASAALNGTYGYDALDRLTSASQGTNAWGFTFDAVGNRLTSTVNAATTTYGYFTGSHRLQSLTGAQVKTYAFDAAGNMASDGTATWTYGGNNRPTQVSAAGTTTQFSINAFGQRVRKATATTGTRFVYDEAGRLWGEYSDAGALISETIWLEDLPVALVRPVAPTGWEAFYVHADHLGTPRMITRPTDNAIVWRWDNAEPFGNSQPDENPSGLGVFTYNLRFPGQYFDQETGTHYNYFRDYDPAVGRYIQSDPIGLRGGINTYAYVDAKPLSLIDPLGLQIAIPGTPPLIGGSGSDGSAAIARGFSKLFRRVVEFCTPKESCQSHYTKCLESGWGGQVGHDSACFACFQRCQGSDDKDWPDNVSSGLRGQYPVSCQYWLKK